MPGRSLALRSGLLAGPHDPTNRFTYWARRVALGGEILVPATDDPVQLIDARDAADWTIAAAEERLAGTFHVTGRPFPFPAMLEECAAAAGSRPRFAWVDEGFLVDRGVEPFADIPLWLALGRNPEWRGFFRADVSRALAHGLTLRPLRETARDILGSAGQEAGITFGTGVRPAGIDPAREAELLEAWAARA
jgi:2'-hydroxyisoflavone reductase